MLDFSKLNIPNPKEVPSMRILMICKYPPIQGGVSVNAYWTAQLLAKLGHDVHVVTNAPEVEEEYRIAMEADNLEKLSGYYVPDSIKIHPTRIDPKHVYVGLFYQARTYFQNR